jgi:hypothetical protein
MLLRQKSLGYRCSLSSKQFKMIFFVHLEKDGKKEAHEIYTDQQITKVIDDVMIMMDKDQDGFISYPEYTVQEVVR